MYSFRLTEEIARWAFEIRCQASRDWYVAFTNPTAGPWKTIRCTDMDGNVGEVYRFELEETRPDIVLVNDVLHLVLIFEAKDSLSKLTAGTQVEKSVEVVAQLAEILKAKEKNPFWGKRAHYPVLTGLLWGAETATTKEAREEVFERYHEEMKCYQTLEKRLLIGIETRRSGDGLECRLCCKKEAGTGVPASLAQSFGISILD